MIADIQTNRVYVSGLLGRRYPDFVLGLEAILRKRRIPLMKIPGTREIWCRDYLPVQVDEGRFVQFRYAPDYLTGRYRHLRSDGEIGPTLPLVGRCERSEIVLDGGNVVGWGDKVILTEKIFAENPGWQRRRLLAKLEALLEVGQVVLIPPEPGDITGHADGVVRFVDGSTVAMSDFGRIEPGYGRALKRRLTKAKLRIVEVPYRPATGPSRGMPSAVGNYVNFLRVGQLVVVPSYDFPEDEEAREILRRSFPGFDVAQLECREVASGGGVLNCICWCVAGRKPRWTSPDRSLQPGEMDEVIRHGTEAGD